MKNRNSIFLVVLLLVIGYASVSTTLYIDGSTNINANQGDFNVYYSDALVNGVRDLSVVESETVITFKTNLQTLGEKYILDYDVTNGSKNYDAEVTMECTQGNEYLTVTNEFDDETVLESLKTRRGKLTLELTKSYSSETDMDITIACTINANAVERNTLNDGDVAESLKNNYSIGRLIVIGDERFNIISETEDTVTMLAQYNLGTNYRQSTSQTGVSFANTYGWPYTPGPKEIDIQTYTSNPKTYINQYVAYLESKTGADISGNLITLSQLKTLGCDINDDYSDDTTRTCINSPYKSWLINNQYWWTRSSAVGNAVYVWFVYNTGRLTYTSYDYNGNGIRPVITIPKSALNNN